MTDKEKQEFVKALIDVCARYGVPGLVGSYFLPEINGGSRYAVFTITGTLETKLSRLIEDLAKRFDETISLLSEPDSSATDDLKGFHTSYPENN